MKKLILLLTLFSSFSYANFAEVEISTFQLWSTTRGLNIIRVIPTNSGSLSNPGNCTTLDSYMVRRSLTEEEKSRMYSTLLAAKMAGISVSLEIMGCEENRPAIRDVILR
ncbi:hypothetical protein J8L84_20050 [Alteromonas sp. MMG017]|uniref:hypothetical protein n=1 Tax=Alteromonas sp. MMG017 TaxID=2822692 RepID=UPI001B3A0F26|nr:hypothetical protein [Alteromonas sp. MMG017]MBQ4831574.1 hypothetical protein [Alteromonas sp. MMG017]